jgi:ABC-type transport system involved in multi-copper enzyme maturation permease subunit
MPPDNTDALTWVRRNFAWSNSRQSWLERLGIVVLGVAALVIWQFGNNLPLDRQVVWWGLWLVGFAFTMRRGWLKLFGPVLFYDLVRIARRSRYVLMRLFYAGFLFATLCSVCYYYYTEYSGAVDSNRMAQMAGTYFFWFMTVQFLAVGLLTPVYTAGAIAEEKERKTLEFMLATDLHNREIVLSKQASRLANLTLLVLTGLPILALMQFLGGIDPDRVLAGFAITGLTLLSLTALAILASVYARKARDAIVLTYLVGLSYLGLSASALLIPLAAPAVASLPLTFWSDSPITLHDVIDWANAGNLVVVWTKLVNQGPAVAMISPAVLRDYAIFHGLVALICSGWAVMRLRAVGLQQTPVISKKKRRQRDRLWERPRVGNYPMVWKEVFAESGLHFNIFGRITLLLLLIASFVPPAWMLVDYYLEILNGTPTWRWFEEGMNAWVRIAGTAVACLTLLGVAVRASGSVSIERDRQTMDSLLTSPLDSTTMLVGKWLGSVLSLRWGWVWLGLIWLVGLATGGLHILALPLLPIAWLIYAGFLAVLGLWFSITCRTTMRANLWTLVTIGGITVGQWLPWMFCAFLWVARGPGREVEHVLNFQLWGLTPPFTLGLLAFHGCEFENGRGETMEFAMDSIVGLCLYMLAAWGLWVLTCARFRVHTGRIPFRRRRPVPPQAIARPAAMSLPKVIPVEGPEGVTG